MNNSRALAQNAVAAQQKVLDERRVPKKPLHVVWARSLSASFGLDNVALTPSAVVLPGTRTCAVNLESGTTAWCMPISGSLRYADGVVAVLGHNGSITGIDAVRGAQLWVNAGFIVRNTINMQPRLLATAHSFVTLSTGRKPRYSEFLAERGTQGGVWWSAPAMINDTISGEPQAASHFVFVRYISSGARFVPQQQAYRLGRDGGFVRDLPDTSDLLGTLGSDIFFEAGSTENVEESMLTFRLRRVSASTALPSALYKLAPDFTQNLQHYRKQKEAFQTARAYLAGQYLFLTIGSMVYRYDLKLPIGLQHPLLMARQGEFLAGNTNGDAVMSQEGSVVRISASGTLITEHLIAALAGPAVSVRREGDEIFVGLDNGQVLVISPAGVLAATLHSCKPIDFARANTTVLVQCDTGLGASRIFALSR